VNLLEQVAFAGASFGHALRASRRTAAWLPWLLVPGASLLALVALAWCAHPLLSPVMAPLLRASVGEEALRYPGLYRSLPKVLGGIRFVLDGLLLPVAFGGSALAFAALYRGREPGAGEVLRETLRLAPVFVLAALPAWLAEAVLRAAVAALPGIRLASVTRALAPHAAVAALVMVRATFFYVVVHAALARRGPVAAVASVPGSFRDGFVPALLTLIVLGVPLAALDAVAAGPFAAFVSRVPESAMLLAMLRDVVAGLAGVLAAGTATLVWIAALAPGERA
jgi:hypothetical protein